MHRRSNRLVVLGKTRSGKTTKAKHYTAWMRPRTRRLVIVNFKPELGELVQKRYMIEDDEDPSKALKKHRDIMFYVVAADPRPFLDKLAWSLLKFEHDIHLLVDEGHNAFDDGRLTDNTVKIFTQGAGLGIHTTVISQMLVGEHGRVSLIVLRQCNLMCAFQFTEQKELERFSQYVPELGHKVRHLAGMNLPRPGLPGEYVIKNFDTEETVVMARATNNPKRLVPVQLTEKKSHIGVLSFLAEDERKGSTSL